MRTRVLLLRHAETANPAIFHGAESDVGLSQRGVREADAVAAYLAGLKPEVLVSSAMRRALDTAGPIARACGLPVQIEPHLHERRVGSLSGTPAALRDGPWPQTLARWLAGETSYALPGAESFDDIRARVVPIWERVTAEHSGKTLVVVAHGVVCKVLLVSLLRGWGMRDWQRIGAILNVAIHELVSEPEGGWSAVRVNELPPGLPIRT